MVDTVTRFRKSSVTIPPSYLKDVKATTVLYSIIDLL